MNKKAAMLICAGLVLVFKSGCMAPVQIAAYPNAKARSVPQHTCDTSYSSIQVLGSVPDENTFEEIGYMTLKQVSDWEYEYTSEEIQIAKARMIACQWGADVIVILESLADIGGDRFVGEYYWDKHVCRVIAIRFIHQDTTSAHE